MSTDALTFEQLDLFISGQGGYHTYRIPALLVTARGTMLAFCEGRRHGMGDAGDIDLLVRRSGDGGKTWSDPTVLASRDGMTCGNPCPVQDQTTGVIWLPYCMNLADGDEAQIVLGNAPRTVWLSHSEDDGCTWSTPVEITSSVKDPAWTWYATGPGHGIQLDSGRLLIPCDHTRGLAHRPDDPKHSHVIYSDDQGATWQIGGIVGAGTNECAALQTADGRVYLNCRNYQGSKRRSVAWSQDDGLTFGEPMTEGTLPDPICQASLTRLSLARNGGRHSGRHSGRNRVLFANAASRERELLTVRVSYDECQSWPCGRVLHSGPAAYSDLAVASDGMICCLYERGDAMPYERLTMARFSLSWLTGGLDSL